MCARLCRQIMRIYRKAIQNRALDHILCHILYIIWCARRLEPKCRWKKTENEWARAMNDENQSVNERWHRQYYLFGVSIIWCTRRVARSHRAHCIAYTWCLSTVCADEFNSFADKKKCLLVKFNYEFTAKLMLQLMSSAPTFIHAIAIACLLAVGSSAAWKWKIFYIFFFYSAERKSNCSTGVTRHFGK